jgi:hypothetical protein
MSVVQSAAVGAADVGRRYPRVPRVWWGGWRYDLRCTSRRFRRPGWGWDARLEGYGTPRWLRQRDAVSRRRERRMPEPRPERPMREMRHRYLGEGAPNSRRAAGNHAQDCMESFEAERKNEESTPLAVDRAPHGSAPQRAPEPEYGARPWVPARAAMDPRASGDPFIVRRYPGTSRPSAASHSRSGLHPRLSRRRFRRGVPAARRSRAPRR